MHRAARSSAPGCSGLPHTRGDAPSWLRTSPPPTAFTPHAWGCTQGVQVFVAVDEVYPTRVGMHRPAARRRSPPTRLPHTRGDAPDAAAELGIDLELTPHAWGCTGLGEIPRGVRPAYPTRVGMHRNRRPPSEAGSGLPHTRGDAPRSGGGSSRSGSLTPHAWGCTGHALGGIDGGEAYPTRVGMHRWGGCWAWRNRSLPHTRGMHRAVARVVRQA